MNSAPLKGIRTKSVTVPVKIGVVRDREAVSQGAAFGGLAALFRGYPSPHRRTLPGRRRSLRRHRKPLLQIVGRTTGGCLSPRFWTYYRGYRIAKGRVRFPRSGSFHEVAPSGESSNGVPRAWKAVGDGLGWHYCGSRSTCDALSRRFRGPCSVVGIVSRRNHPDIGRIRGGAVPSQRPVLRSGLAGFVLGPRAIPFLQRPF